MLPVSKDPRRTFGRLLPLIVAVVFAALGMATLHDYGVTWDMALGDLYYGDRYLYYFVRGLDQTYLDDARRALPFYQESDQVDLYQSPWRAQPLHYYPVGNMVCAACGWLFNRQLGWLDSIDGRHAGIVLLASLAVLATGLFARWRYGLLAGLMAMVLLALHPRFWGHAHNNVKDIGVLAFYTCAMVSFYAGVTRPSARMMLVSGACLGLALGTKLNAAFLPLALAPWLLLVLLAPRSEAKPYSSRWIASLAAWPILGIFLLIGSWPWLHPGRIGRLLEHVSFFYERGASGPDHWQSDPLYLAVLATPVTFLVLLPIGLVIASIHARRNREALYGLVLLLLWLVIPLLRASAPRSNNFDGIRHFLEFLAPAAILSGLGATGVIRLATAKLSGWPRPAVGALVAVAFLAEPAVQIIRYHPYQTTYVNIPALPGQPRESSCDYWGNSYRMGLRWLNEHAPSGSTVSELVPGHITPLVAKVWLRNDLQVHPYKDDANGTPDQPWYVMTIHRQWRTYQPVNRLRREAQVVFAAQSAGKALMTIYALTGREPVDHLNGPS